MVWLLLLLVGALARGGTESQYGTDEENQKIVDEVNSTPGVTWRAALHSRFAKASTKDLEVMTGLKVESADEEAVGFGWGATPPDVDDEFIEIPTDFDAREKWPHCPSINYIRDQGPCGGCWAVDVASMASDRYCIQTGGKHQKDLSYAELLSCSGKGGCHGGSDSGAIEYVINKGLTSGRQKEDGQDTCMPSSFDLCNHHQYGAYGICIDSNKVKTPECPNKCTGSDSSEDFDNDRLYGRDMWSLIGHDQMMREMMLRGPIVIAFHVWKDFYFYEQGVYNFVTGTSIGQHAVRLIGWGTDNGLDYWKITNTWNDNWGENGVIRINRNDPKVPINSGTAMRMRIPELSTEPGYMSIESLSFQTPVVEKDEVNPALYILAFVGLAALLFVGSRLCVRKPKPLTASGEVVNYSGVSQNA